MQRIFYRTLKLAWTDYDASNFRYYTPQKAHIDQLCAEMEKWANDNGFRVISVTPTMASATMGRSGYTTAGPSYTEGLVFVCDKITSP